MKLWRMGRPVLIRLGFFAMGTQVSVTLALGSRRRREAAVAAIAQVEREMQDFGREAWVRGEGALARFNAQLAGGAVATVPRSLRPLLTRAWELCAASGGRFDPRMARLVDLWGFHDMAALRDAPPADAAVEAALAALHAAPAYDGGDSYGPAGVGWDLGGIGKGWIVDRALAQLAELGFSDAIVDAGGNLAVRGARGDRPWRVGIRDARAAPREAGDADDAPSTALLATLMASDEAVNTHGDDQRYFIHRGRRYAHLLDPATGRPASGLRAVTVVHADGTLAEAGGAALYVAGRDGWPALARRLGLSQVLVVTEAGEVLSTPALAARLRPEHGVALGIAG